MAVLEIADYDFEEQFSKGFQNWNVPLAAPCMEEEIRRNWRLRFWTGFSGLAGLRIRFWTGFNGLAGLRGLRKRTKFLAIMKILNPVYPLNPLQSCSKNCSSILFKELFFIT